MQFGVFLFLISAGLTLVLGIMNVVNLAHGSLYMMGAYFASTFFGLTGSLILSLVLMIPVMLVVGMVIADGCGGIMKLGQRTLQRALQRGWQMPEDGGEGEKTKWCACSK